MNVLDLIPPKLKMRLIDCMAKQFYGQVTLHIVNGKIIKWDVRHTEQE